MLSTWQIIIAVGLFVVTYVVMAIGRVPKLGFSRPSMAVIAAVLMLLFGVVPPHAVIRVMDLPTLSILLVLMLISNIFVLSGFYAHCAARLSDSQRSARYLLISVVAIGGVLSAVLANDIVVFAMTPILCEGLLRRGYDPRPYVLALAAAANAGSAATIIGNPQNIMIGQFGQLDFWHFIMLSAPVALVALVIVCGVIGLVWRHQFAEREIAIKVPVAPVAIDKTMTTVGVLFLLVLIIGFSTHYSRFYLAMLVSVVVMLCYYKQARQLLHLIDWRLLALFAGLFVVNAGIENTGLPQLAIQWLQQHGAHLNNLPVLSVFSLLTSNTIGNVPAVIMVLTLWQGLSQVTLYAMASFMTLAGNALLIGSLANIIVVERARSHGVDIGFKVHAQVGLPIAIFSMLFALLWFS